MASRRRRDDETYEDYKKNLKNEERDNRERRKGKMVWISSILAPKEKTAGVCDEFKKTTIRGTFKKAYNNE